VDLTKHGKIDGSCDGKNDWDNAMWGLAPCILNMVVKVGEQNLVDMAKLCNQLDNLFEYIHHELSAHGFRDCVKRFMKSERSRLKKDIKRMGRLDALLVWMQTSGQHLLNIGKNVTHKKRPPN
jgi:hypothetical protein